MTALFTTPAEQNRAPAGHALADHNHTHPLLHDLRALLESRRKPSDRQYVDSLNIMGSVSAHLWDDVRAMSGETRRAATLNYLDQARLGESHQALSNASSQARDQARHDVRRASQPHLPRQHFELRSDGTKPDVIAAGYVTMLHRPDGLYELRTTDLAVCWGAPDNVTGATLADATRTLYRTLIALRYVLPHPHERLSAHLCRSASERALFGERPKWHFGEDGLNALEGEAHFLGLTPETDTNALLLQLQTTWTERHEGLEA